MTIQKAISQAAATLLETGARKATKYLSRTEVVKASLRHKRRKGERTVEMVITAGKPNYSERKFIKHAIQCGEPFPVRQVLLKFYSKAA